ncbi:MAG: hypothetical protein K2Y37_04650 [Pirellulales bacterium]|nr:hypothetical protein [Pirellulales bacterium]
MARGRAISKEEKRQQPTDTPPRTRIKAVLLQDVLDRVAGAAVIPSFFPGQLEDQPADLIGRAAAATFGRSAAAKAGRCCA